MTTTEKRKELKLEFLSVLEKKEAELLSWGVVDGNFTEDELDDLLDAYLTTHDNDFVYADSDELKTILLDEALVFELPEGGKYRSRMAEGIRLLFRLRQVLHWRSWNKAQNLIADYRLLLRPRSYPKRHLLPTDVHKHLSNVVNGCSLEKDVVNELIGGNQAIPWELADFQVDAAHRVLSEVALARKSGTIVCAGTGSGKTLAFYLPALVALARWSDGESWTRCLSLYPRNELLKDQLSSAVKQVRKVNRVLIAAGRPPLRVGAMFGAVPKKPSDPGMGFEQWENVGGGHRCPYLACPSCGEVELTWHKEDRDAGREVLKCRACDDTVGPDLFTLTREALFNNPPDLLFTSLEMVNQRMSDPKLGRLLGLGQPRDKVPRLVLLDEVHTYEGVYGAQAALLLRRWKQMTRSTPHFVGLSATLTDARRFFADFISEREDLVEEISPGGGDMKTQGQEYMLAVRGDPISNTNLLSASIQVAMLLRRLLDKKSQGREVEDGVFGTKVFGFTDNLDVINRLYHNLMDAEGWRLNGSGRLTKKTPNRRDASISEPWLASYRASNRTDHSQRFPLGQSWDLCEKIGHTLVGNEPQVRIARTSSQDAGVDALADVVIATASLEVGYDDPSVGAVIQHKAPQSAAAFLQRKGRAGRQRDMRPWTVVVLSCYGRDRIAYEGYEQLFSPELQTRHLPVSNRYVLRIQATYALMDWFCQELQSDRPSRGHVWQLLSMPPSKRKNDYARPRQDAIRRLAERLLNEQAYRRRFQSYLRKALGLDEPSVLSLMWAPPRSLMMSVLPTLVRRLRQEWSCAVSPGADRLVEGHSFWSPLPQFVPANLFSDLNLPEVQVFLGNRKRPESMGIRQALQEFTPGRVTLRFGVASRDQRFWIPVIRGQDEVLLTSICQPHERQELGEWAYIEENEVRNIRVVRPYALHVEQTPSEVGSSSNGRLRWETQLLPSPDASTVSLPESSPWSPIVERLDFYLHAHANPIEARRFTLGANFTVKRPRDTDFEGLLDFAEAAAPHQPALPAALGFSVDVDGLCFRIAIPAGLHKRLKDNPNLLASTRPALFRRRLGNHEALGPIANVFQREWLARIYLAALVLEAERSESGLEDAHLAIISQALRPLDEVLDVIFRSMGNEDSGDSGGRRAELQAIMQESGFEEALEDCAPVLWRRPDKTWEPWLKRRYSATLVAALREAAQQLCPELDADDLCPDIDPGVRGDEVISETELWLTEVTLGGGGVVEALHRSYTIDPRRFFDLVDAALSPSDFEDVHTELSMLLDWLHQGDVRANELDKAFQQIRSAEGHNALLAAQLELRQLLETHGFRTNHPILTALHARVLRPGSSTETDDLLHKLLQRWEAAEQRLGIEVDGHVFAYLASDSDNLDQALSGLSVDFGNTDPKQWRFDTLYGLLWPRGAAIRAEGLQAYNPYHPLPETDRLLVLHAQERRRSKVILGTPHYQELLRAKLSSEGIVALMAPLSRRRELAEAIRDLLVEPVDLGFLMGFPQVRSLTQEGRWLSLILEIPEVVR